jgi:hypothetical protein
MSVHLEKIAMKNLNCCVGLGLLALCASSPGTTVNLLTVGTSGTLNGAQYVQGNGGSGTGVFPAFMQVTSNGTSTEAYNTTVNNTDDNGSSDQFNHEIQVSQLPIINVGGINYYAFLLDINENNNATDRYLSLDNVKIITSTTPNQSSEPLPTGTTRYDMDAGGNNTVVLDYTLNPGSGQYDMELRVPVSAFAGALPSDYVYLYSAFGGLGVNPAGLPAGDYGTSDGFEEWSLNPNTTVITVPDGGATAILLGLGLIGFGAGRRFLKS